MLRLYRPHVKQKTLFSREQHNIVKLASCVKIWRVALANRHMKEKEVGLRKQSNRAV